MMLQTAADTRGLAAVVSDGAAARGPAHDWEVPRGGHTAGIDTMPHEHAERVLAFLDGSLQAG
jgi:hypothetical protein